MQEPWNEVVVISNFFAAGLVTRGIKSYVFASKKIKAHGHITGLK